MKDEIVEKDSYYELEKAINDFIKNRIDIIDIKYACNYSGVYETNYSAMIIMREENGR